MQLKDWLSPGVIVTALGVIVALIAWLGTRSIKRISYGTPPPVSLFRIHDSVSGRLKATFDNKDISELHLHNICFVNTGTRAIIPQDYVNPITIGFAENAKIVTYGVTSQKPDDLEIPIIRSGDNEIILPQILLNPRDSFYIHLWADTKREPLVKGRLIEGDMRWSLNPNQKSFLRELIELTPMYIVYVGGSYLGKSYFKENWNLGFYTSTFLLGILLYEFFKSRRRSS